LPWSGGVLMALAALVAAWDWYGTRPSLRATATVTENVAEMVPGHGVLYSPRLRFRTQTGSLIQVVIPDKTDAIEFPAGTVLPVLYPAANPAQAHLATVWRLYATAILLAVLGVVLFDAGLILRILLRRQKVRS